MYARCKEEVKEGDVGGNAGWFYGQLGRGRGDFQCYRMLMHTIFIAFCTQSRYYKNDLYTKSGHSDECLSCLLLCVLA